MKCPEVAIEINNIQINGLVNTSSNITCLSDHNNFMIINLKAVTVKNSPQ